MSTATARRLFGTDGIRGIAGEAASGREDDLRHRTGAGTFTAQHD